MAYFSSGSEGMAWRDKNCALCVFGDTETLCPIEEAHFRHNYDQCDDEKVASILSLLVPRTENGLGNLACRMFRPAKPPPPKWSDMLTAANTLADSLEANSELDVQIDGGGQELNVTVDHDGRRTIALFLERFTEERAP